MNGRPVLLPGTPDLSIFITMIHTLALVLVYGLALVVKKKAGRIRFIH